MEKLGLEKPSGKAKILGTVMAIGGAMVLALYKETELTIWSTDINLLRQNSTMAPSPPKNFYSHLLSSLASFGAFFFCNLADHSGDNFNNQIHFFYYIKYILCIYRLCN